MFALVVKNNRLYLSVNACPPARMQRIAREIIQSKEFWIIYRYIDIYIYIYMLSCVIINITLAELVLFDAELI